jgi:hypothetical protein
MWLTSRGRIDIRDVDDEFSTRFRYRLGAFDNTRFDRATGSAIRPAPRSRDTTDPIGPCDARQEDQHSSPVHLNRIGLVLNLQC